MHPPEVIRSKKDRLTQEILNIMELGQGSFVKAKPKGRSWLSAHGKPYPWKVPVALVCEEQEQSAIVEAFLKGTLKHVQDDVETHLDVDVQFGSQPIQVDSDCTDEDERMSSRVRKRRAPEPLTVRTHSSSGRALRPTAAVLENIGTNLKRGAEPLYNRRCLGKPKHDRQPKRGRTDIPPTSKRARNSSPQHSREAPLGPRPTHSGSPPGGPDLPVSLNGASSRQDAHGRILNIAALRRPRDPG